MPMRDEIRTAILAYGADLARWPAKTRAQHETVIKSGSVDDLLREAAALDSALDFAPDVRAQQVESVAASILDNLPDIPPAAGSGKNRSDTGGANRAKKSNSGDNQAIPVMPTWQISSPPARTAWRGASLLVAAFVLGVSVGATGIAAQFDVTTSQTAALVQDEFFPHLTSVLDDLDEETQL